MTSIGKDVEKREPLCTVGGDVIWCSSMENSTEVSKKLKIELLGTFLVAQWLRIHLPMQGTRV